MPKSLSPRAQRLIAILAQDEARKSGAEQLLPEHLLLALLKSAEGLGYQLFQRLKINVLNLQVVLERSIVTHTVADSDTLVDVPPSRRLNGILDAASEESQLLGQDYIGTEHLVLGMIREEQSVTNRFFRGANLRFDDLRRLAAEIAAKNPSSAAYGADLFQDSSDGQLSGEGAQTAPQSRRKRQGILAEFSRDLTELARAGTIDPVVGRDREIKRVLQILSRRTKNNPVLIGDPGVGKTAIAEGIALRIVSGAVPPNIAEKRLLTLDLALIIAGTKYRGEFEERIKRIIKEIAEEKNIILFIDELHTIIGAGSAEGTMDASNMLKPALARGELQCIGATTLAEYRKYFERDAALERRFQIVQVNEPSDEETKLILEGIKKKYENYHGVCYDSEVIDAIVRFARRYLSERYFPDKAIDILDEAGAMKRIEDDDRPPEIEAFEKQIAALNEEKQNAVQAQNFELAADLRDQANVTAQKLAAFRRRWLQHRAARQKPVTVADVCGVIETMTGIPAAQLGAADSGRLLHMETEIHKTVVGQNEAVAAIASSIRRSRAGVSAANRPTGSFVFLGPTGVGKTLLAKSLAAFLFGTENALIRIDMSDFMERHNTSRLTGAPPGYVGYEEGGLLTEKVRRKPYSVILFDEVEKAHPDVFNLLLQLLEEGQLADNLGHTVSFRNTVIIMTSNAGAREISADSRLGFSASTERVMPYGEIKKSAVAEFKKLVSPELLNRIDDIIVFSILSPEEVTAILDLRLAELAARLAEKNLRLSVKDEAKRYLAEHGYDPAMGARPMRRLIQQEIEDPLAGKLLEGAGKPDGTVVIGCKDGGLTVAVRTRPTAAPGRDSAPTVSAERWSG
ncbi:MAG: ATP-dependent Clp protease ATP-binding subunit [Spirochaetaceae bacterium]|jgi:ATP-dependent Clp protease ATP-binding subunit ClpC|nr:ATP-dependent Clp protease ATP-binding subunit [Spirochaetaceae bacterium]